MPSNVWDKFVKVSGDHVKCSTCGSVIGCVGESTSALIKHSKIHEDVIQNPHQAVSRIPKAIKITTFLWDSPSQILSKTIESNIIFVINEV